MPVLKFRMIRGRTSAEIRVVLDVTHQVVVATLGVPERDRYHIVSEHDASHLIALDTGLDIPRSQDFLMIELVSRPRTQEQKLSFYASLTKALAIECEIAPSDVMIYFIENADVDWSFGLGRAQFITEEL